MKKIIALLTVLLLVSCSVQKRKYQKGYYVDWNHRDKKNSGKKEKAVAKSTFKKEAHKSAQTDNKPEVIALTAEVRGNPEIIEINKRRKTLLLKENTQDSCDKILMKNGDEIMARIKEIGTQEIKYKKCEMPDGPDYYIRKQDVFMVTYATGLKERFEEKPAQTTANDKKNLDTGSSRGPKVNDYAIASMICGIAGFLILIGSIPAIVLGIMALNEINDEPDKYEGRFMAIVGIVLGILKMTLLFLIIFLLLSL